MNKILVEGKCYFLLGGIHIEVIAEGEAPLLVEPGWVPFLQACEQKPDIQIVIKHGVPGTFHESRLLFDGLDQQGILRILKEQPELAALGQTTWQIRVKKGKTVVVIGREEAFLIPEDAHHFVVYYPRPDPFHSIQNQSQTDSYSLFPHPLSSLILYYLASFHQALLLHGSGVFLQPYGRIFTGISGSGKTTMARLWERAGARVINDDRILIRSIDGEFRMFNTPMLMADPPKMAPLDQVFFIRHAPENTIRKLEGAETAARLLANCIQHHYRKDQTDSMMQLAIEISQQIHFFELGFLPDQSIIKTILPYG